MTRCECLNAAKAIVTRERNDSYGEPEDNFATIASYWTTYLEQKHSCHFQLTDVDVSVMMTLLKIGRMTTGDKKADNFIDGCGYLACGAELMSKTSS